MEINTPVASACTRICRSACSGSDADVCEVQRIPGWSAQVGIQISRFSTTSVVHVIPGFLWVVAARQIAPAGPAGARTSRCKCSRQLPPLHIPVFFQSNAILTAYPPLPTHNSSFVAARKTTVLLLRLSCALACHASYAYLHSPYKASCLIQLVDGNSYNTSPEKDHMEIFRTQPDSTGNCDASGPAV